MIDDKSYNFSSDMEHYEDSKSKSGSTCTDGLIREYNKDESQIEEKCMNTACQLVNHL